VSKEKRMIALDADYLIFVCTEGKGTRTLGFSKKNGSSIKTKKKYKEPLKPYKDKMKALIQEVEDEIAVNFVGQVKGIKPIFSDPKNNFRYKLAPDYKAGRPPRSELWYRLHKWALKKYGYTKGIEADDEVAYLVSQKGWIGASMDKDLWRGIEGDWFNVYHTKRNFTYTSPMEARNFNLIQNLTGDISDNIKGIHRVGEKTAMKLLDKNGWDWNGVVKTYEEKGLTEEDAVLCRRLICLRQWTPKKGVKLFTPPKP
jgi:hypothetical protein